MSDHDTNDKSTPTEMTDDDESSNFTIQKEWFWEVKIPAKNRLHRPKPRLLNLQILQPKSPNDDDNVNDTPAADDDDDNITLQPNEKVIFNILKDDVSLTERLHLKTGAIEWYTKYHHDMTNIHVISGTNATLKMQISLPTESLWLEFAFDDDDDAARCRSLLTRLMRLVSERDVLKVTQSVETVLEQVDGAIEAIDENLVVTVEIVSAWGLPVGDVTSSDPYCVVVVGEGTLGEREVHRTAYITGTLDPIWTASMGCHFSFETTVSELTLLGLSFIVKDYDRFKKGCVLGRVTIPPLDIVNGKGERKEFSLEKKTKKKGGDNSILVLKFHCNPPEDDPPPTTEPSDDHNAAYLPPRYTKLPRHKKTTLPPSSTSSTPLKLIRPFPDPLHPTISHLPSTTIERTTYLPSHNWTTIGPSSPSPLSTIYLEILGCDDLPSLDSRIPGTNRGKTDAFGTIVYEESCVATDVIVDCDSPRWMPWTRRAFEFRTERWASSRLFLGVFDYDGGVGGGGYRMHDAVGRVTVDVANLVPNTEYILRYNLYTSSLVTERRSHGTITLRLRVTRNERRALCSSLSQPPLAFVNVNKYASFRTISYACDGAIDKNAFRMSTLTSYLDELAGYREAVVYVKQALIAVILWRGHYECCCGCRLPLHSLVAFILGVVLVEYPNAVPSFLVAIVAWIMIAVMGFRRDHPSPWQRCRSYGGLLFAFIFGCVRPATILPHENEEEARLFDDEWSKRISSAKEMGKRRAEEAKRVQEVMKEAEEVADVTMETDVTSSLRLSSLTPLKPILLPIQKILGDVCVMLRIVRNIVLWEECYISFWITTACLVTCIIFFFIPWGFIIHWSLRIIVWICLGPWMKLVDCFCLHSSDGDDEETTDMTNNDNDVVNSDISNNNINTTPSDKETETLEEKLRRARVKKETLVKLKDEKTSLYGEYMIQVPTLKIDRHNDVPLPSSEASPYEGGDGGDDAAEEEEVAEGDDDAGCDDEMAPLVADGAESSEVYGSVMDSV